MTKKAGDSKKVKALLEHYAKKQRFRWGQTIHDKWGDNWYKKSVDGSKVFLREILKDEIVIEFDGKQFIEKYSLDEFKIKTTELINKTIDNLKSKAISFKAYDHGGKCPHVHIFIDELANKNDIIREAYKKNFIESIIPETPELINYDSTLCGIHLIAMEYQPHYKYGTIKELISEEDFGKNKLDKKLLKEIKPASNKQIDEEAKFKAVFEELGRVPCYYEALTKKDVNWKLRNFLVLFLKHNFALKEPEINYFIEQYHGWSDFNKNITSTKIKPYFTAGHKSEKLKGFPKREVLEKNKSCINCPKCYFVREDAVKEKKKYSAMALDEVKEKFHEWIYFIDDDVLDIVFAIAISVKMPGDSLWFFLIAPPGGCKSELLRSFQEGPIFYHLSNLTSKTFVSGLTLGSGENRKKIEDLLPQINGLVLTFKDFTTVLEKDKDERRQIISQLREIYDGAYAHKFGTIDKKVEYKNIIFVFLAGVTPVIDQYWKVMQQLGERFLKCRWMEDRAETTSQAEKNEAKEQQMREELASASMGFLQNIKIKEVFFNEEKYAEFLINLAIFTAYARTPVMIQDSKSDFYYDYEPMPEQPTRLVKQFKKLSKALAIVHSRAQVTEEELKMVRRVAFDTIPQDRLKILQIISDNEGFSPFGCITEIIRGNMNIPESSVYKVLQQLKLLGLVDSLRVEEDTKEGHRTSINYKLTELSKKGLISLPTFPEPFRKKGRVYEAKSDVEKPLVESDLDEGLSRFATCDNTQMKCYVCGANPCTWFDNEKGKHICKACKIGLEANS